MADDEFETEASEIEEETSRDDAVEGPYEAPEDIFSGSVVQQELSADDAYLWVVEEVRQTYPDVDSILATDPELAQAIYNDAIETFG